MLSPNSCKMTNRRSLSDLQKEQNETKAFLVRNFIALEVLDLKGSEKGEFQKGSGRQYGIVLKEGFVKNPRRRNLKEELAGIEKENGSVGVIDPSCDLLDFKSTNKIYTSNYFTHYEAVLEESTDSLTKINDFDLFQKEMQLDVLMDQNGPDIMKCKLCLAEWNKKNKSNKTLKSLEAMSYETEKVSGKLRLSRQAGLRQK